MGRHRVEVGLAFAGFVVIGLGGGAAGVLLPAQIEYYRIDKSVIGLLFFAFSAGYLLAGATNGWLLRRLGLRSGVVLGAASFGVTAFVAGLQPGYGALLGVTVLSGFGSGIIDSGLNSYLAALPRPTVLLNLLHAFYGVGALAGPVLAAGLLEAGLSWGAVYLVFAAASVPLVVGFAVRYPDRLPADGNAASHPEDRTSIFGAAVRHPAVRLCALFLAVYVGVEISVGNWTYSLLVEDRELDPLLAGWVVSGYWFGFTAGRFVLSPLAERFGVGPVALVRGCLAVVIVAGVVVWLVPGALAATAGLVVFGVALGPLYPLTVAVLPRMAPARLVPTAIGLLVGVSVIGGALFPWLAGTLAESAGLGTLLPFLLCLTIVLIVTWWRVSRFRRVRSGPAATGPGAGRRGVGWRG